MYAAPFQLTLHGFEQNDRRFADDMLRMNEPDIHRAGEARFVMQSWRDERDPIANENAIASQSDKKKLATIFALEIELVLWIEVVPTFVERQRRVMRRKQRHKFG